MKSIRENDMTRISILIAVLVAGAGLAWPAGANDGHKHVAAAAAVPANAATAAADGEVRKIDKAAGKVTLKHGPIANIDMPPMTMAYRVKDKAMLDQLQPGDKIKFEADNIGGVFTLMRFEQVK